MSPTDRAFYNGLATGLCVAAAPALLIVLLTLLA